MTEAAPERRCVACRQSFAKSEMLRLVVDEAGQLWPDLKQQLPGRGAWLCMQEPCLGELDDRRLQPLRANFQVAFPQWAGLRECIELALEKQLRQMFAQQRLGAAIGRDAVMHRLWNNAPLLLLQAADAGEALVRQLGDAVEKRNCAGRKTLTVEVVSRLWLGEMLGRDMVAVAGLDADAKAAVQMDRLARLCEWYGFIKVG